MRFLTEVTVTGVDNSIKPEDLIAINKKYSFVEFGILISKNNFGTRRMPSREWVKDLLVIAKENNFCLSAHICGVWVRELLKGNVHDDLLAIINNNEFGRIQINTHGERHIKNLDKFKEFINSRNYDHDQYTILQWDKINWTEEMMDVSLEGKCNILHDLSHGTGVLPDKWDKPIDNYYNGFAGGLSGGNLKEQLDILETVVDGKDIWIDVETHVRSDNDELFDLQKVDKFLEIAKPYCGNY